MVKMVKMRIVMKTTVLSYDNRSKVNGYFFYLLISKIRLNTHKLVNKFSMISSRYHRQKL